MKTTGVVRWWSVKRGYGFIVPDTPALTNDAEVMLHHGNCIKIRKRIDFLPGDRVRFELVDRGRGPLAIEAEKIIGRTFAPNGVDNGRETDTF